MEVSVRSIDEQWAAFWCSILQPLLYGDIKGKERSRILREISRQIHVLPNGCQRRYSVTTLRRKLRRFKKERLKGFCRKRRTDLGKSRVVSDYVIKKVIELKKELPGRSVDTLNRLLKFSTDQTMARSTMYRHLKKGGATRIKLGVTNKPVRRRWTREKSNELWVGDFSEGPYVIHKGEVVPTYLSLFIDCHSRFIVGGRYYYRQNLSVLEDTLLRAFAVHGHPLEIYLDNGKVYHSKAYKLLCAELGIRPIYRKPRDPAPGGLVERFFLSTQNQYESEVRAGEILTLEALNEGFQAYLDLIYHVRKHSETDQTPKERYQQGKTLIRNVDLAMIHGFFMRREIRKVNPIYSDIRLNNRYYLVDKKLRGDKVEVRIDAFGEEEKVFIYSLDGEKVGTGTLHRREEGNYEKGDDTVKIKPKSNLVDNLRHEHKKHLSEQISEIDFRNIPSSNRWPFSAFAITLARGLGRKGELSSFDSGQLESLRKFWCLHANLNIDLTKFAIQKANPKSILQILHELQHLLK